MKKIYLSLMALLLCVVAAQAQRTIGVQVKVWEPVPGSEPNIMATDIVNPRYTITNMGPDTIVVTDTIKFQDPRHGLKDTLMLYYGVSIQPSQTITLDKVVMGPTWPVPFSNINSLYNIDLKDGKVYKPGIKDSTKYAWYAQVVNIVPKKDSGSIIFNVVGSLDTVHVWINKWPLKIGGFATDKSERLSTYPNPASNQLSFDYTLTGSKNATVHVYDALGRVVLSKEIENKGAGKQSFNIDISSIQTGNYFLQIVTDEKTALGKFSVQK